MVDRHSNRYEPTSLQPLRAELTEANQMQLQTAPVLLLYLPTTGPHAKADGQPVRYDFGMGG